jgi:UDP-N-acetyl-D-mannosaminuronic acid transferase (WecB/TagA/CpsF family)
MDEFRRILGIRFYAGDVEGLLGRAVDRAGLIVVPSAPVLSQLAVDPAHAEALEGADFAITDSGFMVLLWLLFQGERLPRISGLRFLRAWFKRPELREPGATFWIMPSAEDARVNGMWLKSQGLDAEPSACYVAPFYARAGRLEDPALLALLEARKPKIIIIGLAGGVQERLGYFLRRRLSYRPTLACTGAAVAFLSGRQASIPVWADRLMLGLLFRTISEPGRYLPRYRQGLRLVPLLWRHGARSVRSS